MCARVDVEILFLSYFAIVSMSLRSGCGLVASDFIHELLSRCFSCRSF